MFVMFDCGAGEENVYDPKLKPSPARVPLASGRVEKYCNTAGSTPAPRGHVPSAEQCGSIWAIIDGVRVVVPPLTSEYFTYPCRNPGFVAVPSGTSFTTWRFWAILSAS